MNPRSLPAGAIVLFLSLLCLFIAPHSSARAAARYAPLEVVTTLRILEEIAREVGGERVVARSLADPKQDPHYVQPRPTLMKRTREADVFIEVGLDLEPWAERVVEGSGNLRIQRGQPGRVIASAGAPVLEIPVVLSRAEGDLYPRGNPHIWLDPLRLRRMAETIARAFQALDPEGTTYYAARLADFENRIDSALFGADLVGCAGGARLAREAERGTLAEYLAANELGRLTGGWLKRAEPLRGRPIVTYHRTWVYFAERFGVEIAGEIEEKPGIPPHARHRDTLIETMRQRGVRTLLVEIFYRRTAADYIAERTGARVLAVPLEPGALDGAGSYFAMVDWILDRLLESEAR